ncbi:TPA: ATP-binding protein, partial [Candidatus Woesearchaeota archaeon]|nr:ATP-binding protein [Candidatus Woesearchaeota archaeon]
MCGIIGVFDDAESVQKVLSGLKIISDRGKDGYGIYCPGSEVEFSKSLDKLSKTTAVGTECIGHCLHSIVGFVPQPLKNIGVLVANCEIYNWEELDDHYGLGAKNDSDMLLKILNLRGPGELLGLLDELDGVYAFAYWRDNKVYICRDIIGVKPVWYSTSKGLGFCSERKALEADGFTDVKELNPREVLVYDVDKKKVKF